MPGSRAKESVVSRNDFGKVGTKTLIGRGRTGSGRKSRVGVWLVVSRDHVWQTLFKTLKHLPLPLSHETSSEIPYACKIEQSDLQTAVSR
jgi:hypothetical protein